MNHCIHLRSQKQGGYNRKGTYMNKKETVLTILNIIVNVILSVVSVVQMVDKRRSKSRSL